MFAPQGSPQRGTLGAHSHFNVITWLQSGIPLRLGIPMNRYMTPILATVLLTLATGPVAAQLPADDGALPLRSEWGAAGLELFVPLAGHAYAGDWTRGQFPTLVRLASAAVAISNRDACIIFCSTEDGDIGWLAAGVAGYFAGTVWGVVSARRTARDRNAALREGRGLETGFAIRPNAHRQLEFAVNVRLRGTDQ